MNDLPGLQAFSLADRRALVTGAGRGIGRGLALGLAAAGAEVVLAGRPGSSEGTLAELDAAGATATAVDLDLSHPDAIGAGLLDRLPGPIHVLVNNAGTISRDDSVDVDLKAWNGVVDVNLTSQFLLTIALAAPMLQRGAGKVINVASLLSFQGGLRVASYAASKHAMAGLTKALPRCVVAASTTASPPAAGAKPPTWSAPRSSWHPLPRTTSTGTCSSWTGDGWPGSPRPVAACLEESRIEGQPPPAQRQPTE